MIDVMEFALEHAFIKMPDGTLKRQVEGIPMGDALSPAMTVITCAWMESEWQKTLTHSDQQMFDARRFMDDILMVYAKSDKWEHDRFIRDVTKSEIYWPPLKLEDAKEATFLETTFRVNAKGQFDYWLKNDNDTARKVWRYQHWRSHTPFAQKKALVVACMRKVHKMASDQAQRYCSAVNKLREFIALQYPTPLLQSICNLMAYTTNEPIWITIRKSINDIDATRLAG